MLRRARPWAGLTPELAAESAARLAGLVDYLVVVRGSIYSVPATRPDLHSEPGFGLELCRLIRAAVKGDGEVGGRAIPVVLQGSVVDPAQAQWALADGAADLVEMTRAQITDPDLVARLRAGQPDRIRPCLLCNQACMVRDNRNPVITCVIEPGSGHEHEAASTSGAHGTRTRARCSWSAAARRAWRRPGYWPSAGTGCGWPSADRPWAAC